MNGKGHVLAGMLLLAVLTAARPGLGAEAEALFESSKRHLAEGDTETALREVEQAIEASKEAHGPEPGRLYTHAGRILERQRRFEDALVRYRLALEARRSASPVDPRLVAASLGDVGTMQEELGRLDEALTTYRACVSASEQTGDPKEVGDALNLLAVGLKRAGRYRSARSAYERALKARREGYGPRHRRTASSLDNLAVLLVQMGDFIEAEPLHAQALAIREDALPQGHRSIGISLSNLGVLRREQGRLEEAASLFRRALEIDQARDPRSIEVAIDANNLGEVLARQGDANAAMEAFALSVRNLRAAYGNEHPRVAVALGNLALQQQRGGAMNDAEKTAREALAITEGTLGKDHRLVADRLRLLARFALLRGDHERAASFLGRADSIEDRVLDSTLLAGNERQRIAFLRHIAGGMNAALNAWWQHREEKALLRVAATSVLRRKGRGRDVVTRARAHASEESLAELREARSRYANIAMSEEGEEAALEEAGAAMDRTERAVLRAASASAERPNVTVDALLRELPPGATLLDFAVVRPFELGRSDTLGEPRYVVFAYEAASRSLRGFVLGSVSDIDALVGAARVQMQDPSADADAPLRRLSEQLLGPLRGVLQRTRTLAIAAEGRLHVVPFAALIHDGRHLVESMVVTRVPSARAPLIPTPSPRRRLGPPLLVGDPSFEGIGGAFAPVDALPGTRRELDALAETIPGAVVRRGEQATEAALRSVAGPRILHLATHGYFMDGNELPAVGARGVHVASVDHPSLELPPGRDLVSSGLLVAPDPHRRDDGVLTALEATSLDLVGTELVTLSACDTGLGVVRDGEGVYGLERALLQAGARAVVVSLWRVNDDATAVLMTELYQHLARGSVPSVALRRAQLQRLRSPVTNHPSFWAAFTASSPTIPEAEAPEPQQPPAVAPEGRCACVVPGNPAGAPMHGFGCALFLVVSIGLRRCRA